MLLVTAGVLGTSASAWAAEPDFNHDGYADLVVSVRSEDTILPGALLKKDTGMVHVIYGSSQGVSATGAGGTGRTDQTFTMDSLGLRGVGSEAGDQFGTSVAWGDFNNDGWTDLAVGIPERDQAGATAAGAVAIIYGLPAQGQVLAGLQPGGQAGNARAQLITQDSRGVAGDPGAGRPVRHLARVGRLQR